MAFNYTQIRYAEIKTQLEFLAEWLALEKNFIPLFQSLKDAGGKDLVDQIYQFVYTGNIAGLMELISPAGLNSLKLNSQKITQVTAAIQSIIGIMHQISDQGIFQKLMGLIQNRDKAAIMKNILNLNEEELITYFSNSLISEIRANPGLLPALRSSRVGLGVHPGIPEARLTSDMLASELGKTFPNDSPWVSNFLNLLTTLMHRSVVSKANLNTMMPGIADHIVINPQQDYAFVQMCQSGASVNSKEAQYDLLQWIEATEKIEEDEEYSLEEKFPTQKRLEMIKKTADFIGPDAFNQYNKNADEFYRLYDILSTTRKPNQGNWGSSELKAKLAQAGINYKDIQQMLYGQKMNFEQILLEYIPGFYRDFYLSACAIKKLSNEEQQAYREKFPYVDKILAGESPSVDNGRDIRTSQLLMLKKAVIQSWGQHFTRFYQSISQILPNIDADKFVQFVYLKDDSAIMEKIQLLGSKLGFDLSTFEQIGQIGQLGKSRGERELIESIKQLYKINEARDEFIKSAGIQEQDIPIFKELLSQKHQLLDISNLFENIPGVARLWSEPTIIAGKEVMNPIFTGAITEAEILQAGGFNPLAAHASFKSAIIRGKETLEEYKDRMAALLPSLIDKGQLYRKYPELDREESPLSGALSTRINSGNSSLKELNMVLNAIREEEKNDVIEAEIELDPTLDPKPTGGKEDKSGEIENLARTDRRRILEDLLARANLTKEDVGIITLNPSSTQNRLDPDPEFKEIGLSTDSEMSNAVLSIIRTNFNLPICSYALEVNSPKGCEVNKNGFKMDFSIMADKLIVGGDSSLGIKPQILLAGEVFGYRKYTGRPLVIDEEYLPEEGKQKDIQIKRNARILQNYQNGIMSADGEWKITLAPDGKQLMAEWPESDKQGNTQIRQDKADRYVEYKIRSSYKEPYESFLSHIIDADVIFIKPFDPANENEVNQVIDDIARQLNGLSILWIPGSSGTRCASLEIIQKYTGELSPELQRYRTSTPMKVHSNGELYAKTLLAHFDLQNVVIPLYYAGYAHSPEQFQFSNITIYYKRYQELCQQLSKTTDLRDRSVIASQLEALKRTWQLIMQKYNQFLEENPQDDYQQQIQKQRQALLDIVGHAGTLTPMDVHSLVFGQKPLFRRRSVVNNVPYHPLSPSIYQEASPQAV